MKRLTSTRLFAIVCMIVMGFVQTWAQTVNKPTINPGSQDYDGNISVTISVEEGCTFYYKWGSRFYSSEELQTASVKKVDDTSTTLTIKGKTSDRYLSAIAVKDNNGTKSYSEATQVKYTYVTSQKKDLTITSPDFAINVNDTHQIEVTAKDGENTISSLTYHYTSDNTNVATVDAKTGVVKGVMAGNASINVIFDGNDTYKATGVIVNVSVKSSASATDEGTVFTNIADVRAAGQLSTYNKQNWVLKFKEDNPATVVGVFANNDPNLANGQEGAGNVFIVDNSGRGLMIPSYKKTSSYIKELKVGDKITGTIIGQYKQRTSNIPEFTEFSAKKNFNNTSYETKLAVDRSGEAKDTQDAIYPVNEITDVHTLAYTNGTIKDGNIVTTAYGIYLNSIVRVPGTIRKKNENFFLFQSPDIHIDDEKNRIYFNSSQIDVNLDNYVGTTGVFEGILIKRDGMEPKLVVLKPDFFNVNEIYIDENDDEKRIDDLVNAGAFDDEVDVYVHRTGLVNQNGAWNTLCFPFDLTKSEFKKAFGGECELSALAKPQTDTDEAINNTWEGKVDENGNLLFTSVDVANLSENETAIVAGVPYLMKATGKQTVSTETVAGVENMEINDIKTKYPYYYAHIGQKLITVVPPHQVKANYKNKIVNGDFYYRGLYGRKKYAEGADGQLTSTLIADSGSQKYQYISTGAGNYLKYLSAKSTLQFNGFRAYFYFPKWDKDANNAIQPSSTTNAKIHIMIDNETTGINLIENNSNVSNNAIYNLAGQKVDASYKGIVIKNGKKYLMK